VTPDAPPDKEPRGEEAPEKRSAAPEEKPAAPEEKPAAPEGRVIEHYPKPLPDDELPPPTFKQALIGYGSILLALVVLGLLIGLLMHVLR
jgi:hypothetical protein